MWTGFNVMAKKEFNTTTVTNVSNGPRGLNAKGGVVMLEKGESREIEISDAEYDSSADTGWFEFGEKAAKKAKKEQEEEGDEEALADLLERAPDMHVATLKSEAKEFLGNKTPSSKDDIIAALEKKAGR